MQIKTHLACSIVIATPILTYFNLLEVASISGVCLGAALPDIDEPQSYIGQKTILFSKITKILFGHRGITHSLFSCFLLTLICYFFASPFIIGLAIGYFLHIVEDSFSISGVKWLLPFSRKTFKFPFRLLTYKTGGVKEKLILVIMLMVLSSRIIDNNKVDIFGGSLIGYTEHGWNYLLKMLR